MEEYQTNFRHTMKFFIDCTTKEQAKEVYRQLAKHFHPDKGGDPKLFQELQQQWDTFQSAQQYSYSSGFKTTNPFSPYATTQERAEAYFKTAYQGTDHVREIQRLRQENNQLRQSLAIEKDHSKCLQQQIWDSRKLCEQVHVDLKSANVTIFKQEKQIADLESVAHKKRIDLAFYKSLTALSAIYYIYKFIIGT